MRGFAGFDFTDIVITCEGLVPLAGKMTKIKKTRHLNLSIKREKKSVGFKLVGPAEFL
jgi:hypothetical protein